MNENINSSEVSDAVIHQLDRTRPWVLFLSILGLFYTLLIVTIAVVQFINSAEDSRFSMLFVNLFFISIHFFIAYFLFKYAVSLKPLIKHRETKQLEKALSSQANFWRFTGIFFGLVTLILLGIISAGLMEILPLFFLKTGG
jgi:hypothetical protein